MFVGVVAPAERRLHWWRWLLVGIAAHLVGTYVGRLPTAVDQTGRAPRRLVNARDVGVSYFVLGVAGTLSGYLERRWRSKWQALAVAALAVNAAARPTFTEVGHLTAFVVGLAAVPLAPEREQRTYPSRRRYLTLQPLPMLWQCPLPLQVGQWQPQAIFACGAGRGAGWTISTSISRSRR